MKPPVKEMIEDYERGMKSIISDIKEKHHLSWEEIGALEGSFKDQEGYNEYKVCALYSTIKALDPSFLSSADVHKTAFEYEDFMEKNGDWEYSLDEDGDWN